MNNNKRKIDKHLPTCGKISLLSNSSSLVANYFRNRQPNQDDISTKVDMNHESFKSKHHQPSCRSSSSSSSPFTTSSKRFQLKRSDSGLSSDSSDPGLNNNHLFDCEQKQQPEQSCHINTTTKHNNLTDNLGNNHQTTRTSSPTTTESNLPVTSQIDNLIGSATTIVKQSIESAFAITSASTTATAKSDTSTVPPQSTQPTTTPTIAPTFESDRLSHVDDDCNYFSSMEQRNHHSSTHSNDNHELDDECHCFTDAERILNDFNSSGPVENYESKSYDCDEDETLNDHMMMMVNDDDSYQYELKVQDLKRQIELISRKVIYMEEHIIDLNTENNSLKKQLNNNEELYRKKIKLREDEIESLKETILDLEKYKDKIHAELKSKEQELCLEKRMHIDDMNILQQQVTSQEAELSTLKKSSERLSELELAYKCVTEQLEALKISNIAALNELEENYKLKCAEKNIEIGILNAKVDELNHQLIQMDSINNRHRQQKQQFECTSPPLSLLEEEPLSSKTTITDQPASILSINTTTSSSSFSQSSDSTTEINNNNRIGQVIKAIDDNDCCHSVAVGDVSSLQQPTQPISTWTTTQPSSHNNNNNTVSIVITESPSNNNIFNSETSHTTTSPSNTSGQPTLAADDQKLVSNLESKPTLLDDNQHTNCSENFVTLNQEPSSNKPKPKRKMATTSRKWPLKRIQSCDIDEDVLNSLSRKTSINSDAHSSQCGDLMTLLDNNNNCTFKSDLASICPSESRAEVFPSLPDVMLRKLCLLRESTCSIESLSEQEIDAKFHTLLLAFKTDKFTLDQRIQLYRHQRDMAENDAKTELGHLSEYVQELYRLLLGCDSKFFYNTNFSQLKELKDMLDKIDLQVQVINASVMKISSRSELYGSVKQEERLSTALDVILMHTENLKRAKERDAKELEDMKRLVATSGIKNSDMDNSSFDFGNFGRRSGRKSKDANSKRINPLLMASHLQNVQVSYQQTTSGPSKQYLRTRRLSVPAAEIRNRPKLLQLLSETSVKRLSEELSENFANSKSDDEQSNSDKSDQEKESGSDENQNSDEMKTDNRKHSNMSDSNHHNNYHHQTNKSDQLNEENEENVDNQEENIDHNSSTSNNEDDEQNQNQVDNCNNKDENNNKINTSKFYSELVRRLAPFEDKTFKQRISDKFRNIYKACWLLIIAISHNSKYKLHLMKRLMIGYGKNNKNKQKNGSQKNSYESIRYIISGGLVLTSIFILIWSIILPMFYK